MFAMKKINAKLAVMLVFCILSSAAFVGGIPMIIFCAANHVSIVMIAGIIMTAFDFYACPILWINFGGAVALKAVVKAVEEENLYTAEEIAVQQNKEVKIVVNQIRTCMQKGYIKGYLFDGEKLTLNENRKQGRRLINVKCANCGAAYGYYSDEEAVCPYCGTPANQK